MSARPTWKTRVALVAWSALLVCGLAAHGAQASRFSTPWQPGSSAADIDSFAGELRRSYRRALLLLASNDSQGALASLLGLESSAFAEPPGPDPEELGKLERQVVEDLLPAGGELLLPVILLHQQAYLELRGQRLDLRASHARSMVMLLSELYAKHAYEVETRRIASDLFASLGGLYRQSSALSTGLEFYSRSLRFDRNNEAALLGMGVAYEQRGKYKRALSYLERSVEALPSSTEAQLHLAINLDRFGRHTEAIRALERLLDQPAPNWQLSLAYQELARILLRRSDLFAARTVLQQGLERFPLDSTMLIALAHVDNLRGSGSSGSALGPALRRSALKNGFSPRYLYSRDPERPLERVRQRLRDDAVGGLRVLADALSSGRRSND